SEPKKKMPHKKNGDTGQSLCRRVERSEDLPDSVFYLKIFTAGHEVPSDPTILSFKRAVCRFLQDNVHNGQSFTF
ncbi:unnamed protein product, partial [Coregonus sp. 'balchen']